jgi:hypothetical protein
MAPVVIWLTPGSVAIASDKVCVPFSFISVLVSAMTSLLVVLKAGFFSVIYTEFKTIVFTESVWEYTSLTRKIRMAKNKNIFAELLLIVLNHYHYIYHAYNQRLMSVLLNNL